MQALQTTQVLDALAAAGLRLSLTPDHGLKVMPASCLTDSLRAMIREHKPKLVDYLQRKAANDETLEIGAERPDPDPECQSTPHALPHREIHTFTARLNRFANKGLPIDVAERLAEALVIRDREWDERRLCLECTHLQGYGPWRCGNWKLADVPRDGLPRVVVRMLQRCDGFQKAK